MTSSQFACYLMCGRVLHQYHRGHGFKSHTGLNFFLALFSQVLKQCSQLQGLLPYQNYDIHFEFIIFLALKSGKSLNQVIEKNLGLSLRMMESFGQCMYSFLTYFTHYLVLQFQHIFGFSSLHVLNFVLTHIDCFCVVFLIFRMSFEDFCSHFTNATLCHVINTSIFSLSNRWHVFKHNYQWSPGSTAGGCVENRSTFLKNPQVHNIFL